MNNFTNNSHMFETEKISKILIHLAPPVMFAQLIQALYNIVDSYFVGKFSSDALTALSVIFPIQFIIIALGVGTGVGVNTYMAFLFAHKRKNEAKETAGSGAVFAIFMWAVFALLSIFFLKYYVSLCAKSPLAIKYSNIYGQIVCVGSLGIFLESIFTKIHQAGGNMKIPMIAQVCGALINIVFDPILIFGIGFFPKMGVAGAAIATVAGQFVAAIITGICAFQKPPVFPKILSYGKQIYRLGYPQIFMQLLITLYIVVLNIILARFCDEAVTVLGLYYKIQTFFFIPLFALQTCIVPVLSYNYARKSNDRCMKIMSNSIFASVIFMLIGVLCFEFFPKQLIALFSSDKNVLDIGINAFRIIGLSFIPSVFSLIYPVFFQAIGAAKSSVLLAITRQIFCLIPIFAVLSLVGLDYVWFAFPLSEIITGGIGFLLYVKWKRNVTARNTTVST